MRKILSAGSDAGAIREAVRVVHLGGVIAYPTETFYALGADPFNEEAVQRIFAIKRRAASGPILLLVPRSEYLPRVVQSITPLSKLLIDRFWPGPLTVVLQASESLPQSITAGTGTVGVRLCGAPIARALLELWGSALTATSANRSGEPPPTRAAEVIEALGDDVDWVIDGGPTPGGLPSTVVDARRQTLSVIREGQIASSALASALV